MYDTKVSVIMPVYNGEKTIRIAVNSILRQSYKNIELIIVDDGSTDKTLSIVKSIEDRRIVLISISNHGRGYARNVALKKCTGDFITFLDSDDICDLKRIGLQVSCLLENKEVDIVGSSMLLFNNLGPQFRTRNKGGFSRNINDVNCATVMLRRESVGDIEYNTELNRGEDIDFLARVFKNGCNIMLLNETLYYYYFGDVSKSKLYKYNRDSLVLEGASVSRKFIIITKWISRYIYIFTLPVAVLYYLRYPTRLSKKEINNFYNNLHIINDEK